MSDRDDFRVGGYNTNSAGPASSSPQEPTTQLADSIGSGPEVSNDWFTGQWLIERSTWRAYEIGTSHVDEDAIHVITKSAYDAVCAQLAEAQAEIDRLRREVVKRNQYKINEEYLANVHTHYEGIEKEAEGLRALVRELVDGLQQMLDGNGFSNEYTTEQGEAAEALLEKAKGVL